MRIKKLSELTNKSKQRKEKAEESKDTKDTSASSTQEEQKLSERVGDNLSRMKKALGQSTDLVVREFRISIEKKFTLGVAYIDGLVNKDEVEHYALDSIMHYHDEHLTHDDGIVNMYELIKSYSLAAGEIMEAKTLDDALLHVLSGDSVLFLEGYQTCIVPSTRGWRDRAVSEPQSQTVVRGPRDSFTETLRTNTALIRRRIKSPKLWIESQQIGEFTKTDIALVYIDGIADEQVIQEVKERLSKIDIDGILESGYIEELNFFCIGSAILAVPATLLETNRQNAWVCSVLAIGFALLIVAVLLWLMHRYPQQTFIEIAKKALGPYAGTCMSLIYIFLCSFNLRFPFEISVHL
ncbi:GerAB/ArcD/ProY family transporter [Priestia megaterium]|uniref:GerAB/ArcD/ProY family transporter n=1 Tax=Priestia megaterium TaxID=1404 RepID=UPI003672DDC1